MCTKGEDDPIIKSVSPEEADGSFTVIWNYQGREVPIKVIVPAPEEMDRFIDGIAQFLWRHRHLGKTLDEPKHSTPGVSE